MISLQVIRESFRLAEVFTISRGSRTEAHVISVTLAAGGARGRGECVPYARYDESLDSVEKQILGVAAVWKNSWAEVCGDAAFETSDEIRQGVVRVRQDLQNRLPGGAARNALDCALWDLEAKLSAQPVWQIAGLTKPAPVTTAYTLSLGDPASMQQKAQEHAYRPLLKIKLGGEGDIERLKAVRAGAPDSTMIVDANEAWSAEQYRELAPVLLDLGVAMVEQPFPAGDDGELAHMERPLPVCADESCHDVASLPTLLGKYDMINIKLDKTGGLTEAIALEEAAKQAGFQIMVGCMVGTSLAMAPAMLVCSSANVIDLDAPLLLAEDRDDPMHFDGSQISPAIPALWG